MADTGPGAGERMVGVRFTDDVLSVGQLDGRTITVPIAWYPRLLHAPLAEHANWRISAGGFGIHWPDIDEDLSSEGLLRGAPAPGSRRRVHSPSGPSMRYAVVIERSGTGFAAWVPDLPGCVAAAETEEELRRQMKEAIDAGTVDTVSADDVFEELDSSGPMAEMEVPDRPDAEKPGFGALLIQGAREALAHRRKTRRRVRIEPPTTCLTAEACLAVDPAVWSAHVDAVRAEARKGMDAAAHEGAHERARHWRLFAEVVELDPRDWAPLGLMERERLDGFGPDCSAGCAWFLKIQGDAGSDCGVCGNPASHRVGRLTFEHQGCPEFEQALPQRAPQARPRR